MHHYGADRISGVDPLTWPFARRTPTDIDHLTWQQVRERVGGSGRVDAQTSADWRQRTQQILSQKRITTVQDLELSRRERILLAALLAIPVIGLDLTWYRGWKEVLLYPGAFRQRYEYEDEIGVVHSTDRTLAGEAWLQGPLVLSWDDVTADLSEPDAGCNVAIHECAHKLDLLQGGEDNGFPPLHRGMDPETWSSVFSAAFEDLGKRLEQDMPMLVDPYAGDSPGEFFAVLSEHFFVVPETVQSVYPAVYAQLRLFYRQDPLAAR